MKRYKVILTMFLSYLGAKKRLLWLSFGLTFLSQIALLYLPILTGKALDQIMENQIHYQQLFVYLIVMLLLSVTLGAGQWLVAKINQKVSLYLVKEIRKSAFQKLHRLPLSYLDQQSHGDLISKNIGDVEQLGEGMLMTLSQLASGITTILVTVFFMFRLSPAISLVVIALTPLSLFVASFIAGKSFVFFQMQANEKGKQTGFMNEMLENLKVVKACQREEQIATEFSVINTSYAKTSLKAIFYSSTANPGIRFVNNLIYTVVALFGAGYVLRGVLSIGGLTAFLSYANQYTKPFHEISVVVTELQNALASAERVFALLSEVEVPDEQLEMVDELKHTWIKDGTIELENIYFSYNEKPFIQNLNVQIHAGQKVALVGPTGCGKTTLINLLMRFYEPQSGRILMDGKDIKTVNMDELRRSFGMVLQDTWIRKETILNNIRIAKPDASREDIIHAAEEAYADYFIRQLPFGYDTLMEEGGGSLSEGQKQLISIARIILQKPKLLILDEATASMDTRTEVKIQQALSKLMENKTSFIVAHRLSTIVNADVILVMKAGEMIEKGTHEELLKKQGFYERLYYKLN